MSSIKKFESAPCIYIYEDYFDSSNFIELIEKESIREWPYLDWIQSRTGNSENFQISTYRTSLEMSMAPLSNKEIVDDLKELQEIYLNNIFYPIDKCVHDYRNIHDLSLRQDSGYNLLKYSHSAEYHIHHDHGSDNSRVLSLVACLGDDDFEGGELEFNKFNLTIKLKKNSLIIFPSNFPYTHIAHPVTRGVKYSLVTWFI